MKTNFTLSFWIFAFFTNLHFSESAHGISENIESSSCLGIEGPIISCNISLIIRNKLHSVLHSQFFYDVEKSSISDEELYSDLSTVMKRFPDSITSKFSGFKSALSIKVKVEAIAKVIADSVIRADPSGSVRVNVTDLQNKISAVYHGSNTVAEAQALVRVVRSVISESQIDNDCSAKVKADLIGTELADLILRILFNDDKQTRKSLLSNESEQLYLRIAFIDLMSHQIESEVNPSKNDLKVLIVNLILRLRPKISEEILDPIIESILDKYNLNYMRIFDLLDDVTAAVDQIILNQDHCSEMNQTNSDLSRLWKTLLDGLTTHRNELTSMYHIKKYIVEIVMDIVSQAYGEVSVDVHSQIFDAVDKIVDRYTLGSVGLFFDEIANNVKIEVGDILIKALEQGTLSSDKSTSEEIEESDDFDSSTVHSSPTTESTLSTKKQYFVNDVNFSFDIIAPSITDSNLMNGLEDSIDEIINTEITVHGPGNLDISYLKKRIEDLISNIRKDIRIVIYDYSRRIPFIVNIQHGGSAEND